MRNPTFILSSVCGTMLILYIFLVGLTVYFASVETHLSSRMRDMEGAVSALEAQYYDAISDISAQNPFLIGYATPARVDYVTHEAPGLSLVTTGVKP